MAPLFLVSDRHRSFGASKDIPKEGEGEGGLGLGWAGSQPSANREMEVIKACRGSFWKYFRSFDRLQRSRPSPPA
jgi:hypothetical protein